MKSILSTSFKGLNLLLILSCFLLVLPVQAEFIHREAPSQEQELHSKKKVRKQQKRKSNRTKRTKRQQNVFTMGILIFFAIMGFLLGIIAPIVFLIGGAFAWELTAVVAAAVSILSLLALYLTSIDASEGLSAAIIAIVGIIALLSFSLLLGTYLLIIGSITSSLIYMITGAILLGILLLASILIALA